MPAEAERVHGLSEAFLADKPLFATKRKICWSFWAIAAGGA
jgi:DNA polymerase III epsilon subunit-like protein